MKTIKITTPTNIEIEYKLAGVGSRLAAATLDLLIQLAIIIFGAIILYSIDNMLVNFGVLINYNVITAVLIIFGFVVNFGYFLLFELTTRGQSIGKKAFGLRAIRDNGQPVEFTNVLVRSILRATIDSLYVGVFIMFFSKKNKRLGDIAGGTIVVIEKRTEKYQQPLLAKEPTLPDFVSPLHNLSEDERQVIELWQRKKDTLPYKGKNFEHRLQHYFKTLEELRCKEEQTLETRMAEEGGDETPSDDFSNNLF